jgi:hypothetical protein
MILAADPCADVPSVVSSFAVWLDEHGDQVAGLGGHPQGDLVDRLRQRPFGDG